MKTLILDNKNWQLGSSDNDGSDFSGIAGISPDYKGQNYFISRGNSIAGQPSKTAMSGSVVSGKIIASILDKTGSGDKSIFVDDTGKLFYTNGLVVTQFGNDSTDTAKYRRGKTEIKYFKGVFFMSKENGLVMFHNDYTTIDYVWWTTTKGKTAFSSNGPHPMEVVEDTLYIADVNKIHTWDGTTAVEAQFSLPDNYTITAMKIHTDGRYLKVFATDNFSYNHAEKVSAKLFMLDTLTLEFTDTYEMDEQVEGAINFGGVCFCTYGYNFGYFDGSGLKLIRKIDVLENGQYFLYSSYLKTFDNCIIFPANGYINAFGDINGKGNIFFYPFLHSTSNGYYIYHIIPVSNTSCLIQYIEGGTPQMARIDFNTKSDLNLQTTKIDVGGRIWIRKVEIFMEALQSGDYLFSYFRDVSNNLAQAGGTISYALDGAIVKKTIFCNILADFIQPYIGGQTKSAIKKIHVQYESAE